MRDGTGRTGSPTRRAPANQRSTSRCRNRRRARRWGTVGLAVSLAVLPAATATAHGPGTEPTQSTLPPGVGLVELGGVPLVRVYDPATNRWTQRANMHFSRWYPTAVMLPNGKVFVDTGTRRSQRNDRPSQQRLTETYDPATNRWTVNNT